MKPCPFCNEPSGFHTGVCHVYDNVPAALRGPGNSKEFMVWLRDRLELERQTIEAERTEKLAEQL